jgi:hypothetical protein
MTAYRTAAPVRFAVRILVGTGLIAAAFAAAVEDAGAVEPAAALQRVSEPASEPVSERAIARAGVDAASPDLTSELEQAARRFAQAWAHGDVDQVVQLLSSRGIRLRLEGMDRNALAPRQAIAALRDFLRGHEPGAVSLVRAAPVAGTPGRGFAELRWRTRVAGTSHEVVRSLFLGMVLEGGDWRVDELRLLP